MGSQPLSDLNPKKAVVPRIVDIDSSLDGGSGRAASDGFGNAISNGSFSKIVGPGCPDRLGRGDGNSLIRSLRCKSSPFS